MNEEITVIKDIAERLDKLGVPYMVSGSTAANQYTIPRMTRDIDVVVEVQSIDIKTFIHEFTDDYYLEEETVKKEVESRGMFNLIHKEYIFKLDFIIKKDTEFQYNAFLRRKQQDIDNRPVWFISCEDLIIAKLMWAKDSQSPMQIKDVNNLLKSSDKIDMEYINQSIKDMNLEEIYNKALKNE